MNIPIKPMKNPVTKFIEHSTNEMDIYNDESINEYCDGDAINAAEQGFMQGYLNA